MVESVINIENISMSVPSMSRKILNKINYDIYPGDFVVVLGSNGSGKSTLIKLIDQSIQPTEGKINYFLSKQKKQHLDIMTLTQNMEENIFPNMTALENFLLWSYRLKSFKLFSRTKLVANKFELYLQEMNSPLQHKMHTNISHLSGGEKQAFLLTMCFYLNPKLLLLDEHTSALDPKMSDEIIKKTANYVKLHKIPCVMTTHNIEHALNFGNRLMVLKNGEIILQLDSLEKNKLQKSDLISLYY